MPSDAAVRFPGWLVPAAGLVAAYLISIFGKPKISFSNYRSQVAHMRDPNLGQANTTRVA